MSEQILLVDREPNRSRLLQRRLERHGFAVTSVGSLDDLTVVAEVPSRLMVVDLALLCGAERGQLEELVSQMLDAPIHECRVCGRRLREIAAGTGELTCCGQPMQFIAPTEELDVEQEAVRW